MRDQIPESKTSQTVSDFIQKHFVGIKKNLAVMEPCMYTVTVSFFMFAVDTLLITAGFNCYTA